MNDFCVGLICLLASTQTHADEAFVGYGVGMFHDANQFIGQMKVADLGYRHFLYDGIYWQNKLGFWGEASGDPTRKSSGFLSSGLGMEMDLKPIEIRGGAGLAGITSTDSQLGGIFQFNEDFSIGLRDNRGDGIAFQYNHLSCASFCSPNQGRDFGLVEFSLKVGK